MREASAGVVGGLAAGGVNNVDEATIRVEVVRQETSGLFRTHKKRAYALMMGGFHAGALNLEKVLSLGPCGLEESHGTMLVNSLNLKLHARHFSFTHGRLKDGE